MAENGARALTGSLYESMSEKNKSVRISFRLTDSEYEPFKQVIEELGITKSEFFRLLITDRLDPEKHNKKSQSDYNRLLFLFNKTSNNINQIAKNLNILFKRGDITEREFKKWLSILSVVSSNLLSGLDNAK